MAESEDRSERIAQREFELARLNVEIRRSTAAESAPTVGPIAGGILALSILLTLSAFVSLSRDPVKFLTIMIGFLAIAGAASTIIMRFGRGRNFGDAVEAISPVTDENFATWKPRTTSSRRIAGRRVFRGRDSR